MNILIVDDDRFVIAALRASLNWEKLGFQNIYTASNIHEAKKILVDNRIHLLLSDIDMPNGSGLDLLAWARENHNNIPTIFLTNYADFSYAQRAVELKTFYYFLKPIEYEKLENIIMEAVQEFTKRSKMNSESFWHFLITKPAFIESSDFQDFWEQSHELYTINDYFLPVIFDLLPYSLESENTLKNHFSNSDAQTAYLTTTFHAVFSDLQGSIASFLLYNVEFSRYIAIFHSDVPEITPVLLMNCENFITLVNNQIHCTLNCFIGVPSCLQDFQHNFSSLCSMASNKIDILRQVVRFDDYRVPASDYEGVDSQLLELHLNSKRYDLFLDYCSQYLKKLSRTNTLSATSMANLQIDVLNVLYTHLKSKELLPNKLFQSNNYHLLSRLACRTIAEMELYLKYIVNTARDCLETSNSEQSITESLKKYADQHYTEDIHASDIADIFYIDPDYGSRLFKKQYGISFKNYIIFKRIETAKKLLTYTDLSINMISSNIGYDNYSYFTRLFKKTEGVTPVEYRAQNANTDILNGEEYLSSSPYHITDD